MAFNVPNAVNYSSPLNAVPLDWTSAPVEGPKGIQCSIAWGTQGGSNNAVSINLQNNATLNFSKIRGLIIDNSMSGADVQFVFPDTETTTTIPAYTPYAILPVFTNQTQFYVVSPNADQEDVTNFTVLNTAPLPVAVPTTQEQNIFTSTAVDIHITGNQQLVPATVSGTLEAIAIRGVMSGSATGGFIEMSLVDGTGATLLTSLGNVNNNVVTSIDFFSLGDLRLRFQNGLKLTWATQFAPTAAFCSPNLYYRQP